MTLQATDQWYQLSGDTIVAGPQQRPKQFGPNSDIWPEWGELWRDTPDNPYKYADLVTGTPTVVAANKRIEQVDTWVEWNASDKREHLQETIYLQVPQHSATDVIIENTVQEWVDEWAVAAWNKKQELDATPNDQLDAFDPTLEEPTARIRSDVPIAKAPPLTWALMYHQEHDPSKMYLTNTLVHDEGWVGVSNKMTMEPIKPQPENNLQFLLYGNTTPSWEDAVTISPRVACGMQVTPTQAMEVKAFSYWATDDAFTDQVRFTFFEVEHLGGEDERWHEVHSDVPTSPGWNDVHIDDAITMKGETFTLLMVMEESDVPALATGHYNYRFNHRQCHTGQICHFRQTMTIWHSDADGVDMSAAVLALVAGDRLNIGGHGYRITGVSHGNKSSAFVVTPTDKLVGGRYPVEFVHYPANALHYARKSGHANNLLEVKGIYGESLDTLMPTDDCYGLDIWMQNIVFSKDWDLLPVWPEQRWGESTATI